MRTLTIDNGFLKKGIAATMKKNNEGVIEGIILGDKNEGAFFGLWKGGPEIKEGKKVYSVSLEKKNGLYYLGKNGKIPQFRHDHQCQSFPDKRHDEKVFLRIINDSPPNRKLLEAVRGRPKIITEVKEGKDVLMVFSPKDKIRIFFFSVPYFIFCQGGLFCEPCESCEKFSNHYKMRERGNRRKDNALMREYKKYLEKIPRIS